MQAKRLQADIERSKATAREIVQEAEAGKALKAHAGDAANKVDLLRKELDFNETLAGTLETLQVVAGLLDSVQNAMGEDERDLSKSLGKLEEAQRTLGGLDGFKNMRFAGLLEKRTGQIKERLVEEILGCWNSLVVVDTDQQSITVLQEKEGKPLTQGFVKRRLKLCIQERHCPCLLQLMLCQSWTFYRSVSIAYIETCIA